MRELIYGMFAEMWREDKGTEPPEVNDDTVLLETGFDSMSFAVMVARLDDELGFDPFAVSDDIVYPTTFREFIAFYENQKAA